MKQFLASFLEVVELALVAVGGVFLIRTFLVQPFLVNGSSMVPNFEDGDYLLVDELTYRFRPPERGEVVVFHYPNDTSTYFIKRIIGLPHERIEITDGRIVLFKEGNPQGEVLHEPYLAPGYITSGERTIALGEDEYFVLGDNRSYSFDSRSWGALSRNELVGVVRLRLWPFANVQAFAAPQY
jgi:signal peptidase I